MSASRVAFLVLGVVLLCGGLAAIVWLARIHRAGRRGDDLDVARAVGVLPSEHDPVMSWEERAAEVAYLVEKFDNSPDAPPPIVPGRDGPVRLGEAASGQPEGICRYDFDWARREERGQ